MTLVQYFHSHDAKIHESCRLQGISVHKCTKTPRGIVPCEQLPLYFSYMKHYTGKGRNGQDKQKKTCRKTRHVKIEKER